MVRHADLKPIVMKEEVYAHRSLEPGGRALWGSAGLVRRQRGRSMAQDLYWDFLWQGMEQEGKSPGKVRIGWFE